MLASLLSITSSLENYKLVLALVPIIIGTRAIPFKNNKIKAFFLIVCLNAVIVAAGIITSGMGNNLYILYIFAPLEAIIYSFVLFPEEADKQGKRLVVFIVGLALLMNMAEALFITGGIALYNSITYTLVNLVLGILAIRMLLKLRFNPAVYQLTDEPLFWIALSVAIYKFGTLINWAFFKTVQISGDDAIIIMTFLGTVISYIAFGLNTVALWKARRKKTKSTPKLAT